jgi:hypothetical protein
MDTNFSFSFFFLLLLSFSSLAATIIGITVITLGMYLNHFLFVHFYRFFYRMFYYHTKALVFDRTGKALGFKNVTHTILSPYFLLRLKIAKNPILSVHMPRDFDSKNSNFARYQLF